MENHCGVYKVTPYFTLFCMFYYKWYSWEYFVFFVQKKKVCSAYRAVIAISMTAFYHLHQYVALPHDLRYTITLFTIFEIPCLWNPIKVRNPLQMTCFLKHEQSCTVCCQLAANWCKWKYLVLSLQPSNHCNLYCSFLCKSDASRFAYTLIVWIFIWWKWHISAYACSVCHIFLFLYL